MRWYQFDPTKWWVLLLTRVGQAWDLRRVPRAQIERVRAAASSQT
ncbi:MAG: hypothetical protein AAF628_29595 [Planctomycetota bacterium]